MRLLIFLSLSFGLYLLLTLRSVTVYRPAAAVLRRRAPKPLTQTQIVIARMAALIRPYMDLEPIQRERLADTLANLGHTESPEDFRPTPLQGPFSSPPLLPGPRCSTPSWARPSSSPAVWPSIPRRKRSCAGRWRSAGSG